MDYEEQEDIAETPDQEDAEVMTDVVTDFNAAWKSKQSKEWLFREVYRRYRSYLEVTNETTRSTLFIPESFTLVETVAPRMTAQKPSFKVIPRDDSTIEKADLVGKHIDYRYDKMGLQHKLKIYVKQALIYGTSHMKMGWDSDAKSPVAEVIDIADIYGDPQTYNWSDGFMIHRYWMQVEELKRSKVKYQNLDLLSARESTSAQQDQMRQDRESIQGVPYDNQKEGVEILEQWKWCDGTLMKRVVADRSVLILNVDNPMPLDRFPFVALFDQEVPFERWGIGEIEPIMDLQDEENTTRNQRIDEKNLSIHNMWVVSKLAGVDYRNLVSKPGGIILANDINGVKPLDKQNITQDSILEINMIKEDIRNATGVNDYVRGAEASSGTATEVVSKTQEANQRFSEKISNLELALKQVGEWIVALDGQFLTKDVELKINGDMGMETKKLSKKDLQGQYDVDIETGSSLPANPDLRRQQMTQMLQVVGPYLMNPQGIPDGMRELLRSIIQSYDLKNTDKILQGAEHPEVGRVMAQLHPDELGKGNAQMVQAEVKRHLAAAGAFSQQSPQQQQAEAASQPKPPATSISFKDLPPQGQSQLAHQAGIELQAPQAPQVGLTPPGAPNEQAGTQPSAPGILG